MQAWGVAAALLAALRHYFPSAPNFLPALLASPAEELVAEWASLPPNRPVLPAADFRRTYAALCDYYKLDFRWRPFDGSDGGKRKVRMQGRGGLGRGQNLRLPRHPHTPPG